MDVLGDLVARDRRRKEPLVHSGAAQPYTAHKFCTDAWKSANLFRYHGAGPDRPVAVADDPRPQALLCLFGAALLGTHARFGFPPAEDARLAVGPADAVASLPDDPARKCMAYADEPDDPAVVHFERAVWSENPTMPPDRIDSDSTVLVTDDDTFAHTELLAATEHVVAETDLADDDTVAVRASLSHPGTVVAGVLAPLSVGAEILLASADATGTVAVADGETPEERTVTPADAAP